MSVSCHVDDTALVLFFYTQPQNQPDHFPEIKLPHQPATGPWLLRPGHMLHNLAEPVELCPAAAHLLLGTPELFMVLHFQEQGLCCTTDTGVLRLTEFSNESKIKVLECHCTLLSLAFSSIRRDRCPWSCGRTGLL